MCKRGGSVLHSAVTVKSKPLKNHSEIKKKRCAFGYQMNISTIFTRFSSILMCTTLCLLAYRCYMLPLYKICLQFVNIKKTFRIARCHLIHSHKIYISISGASNCAELGALEAMALSPPTMSALIQRWRSVRGNLKISVHKLQSSRSARTARESRRSSSWTYRIS